MMTMEDGTAGNSSCKELAVQWLIEAFFFFTSSVQVDSLRFQNSAYCKLANS